MHNSKNISKNIQTSIKNVNDVNKKLNTKIIIMMIIVFILAFFILYREAEIDKKLNENMIIKKQSEILEKENNQEEILVQNNVSLTNIEELAKQKLKMRKISAENTVQITFNDTDFIENINNEKLQREDESFLIKIYKYINGLFNK